MSRPKVSFSWPRHERVTVITMDGATIVSVKLLEDDRLVPDPAACLRYSFSSSHLDRMNARGEVPPLIKIGARLKARWASAWLQWELEREVRRELPAPPRRRRRPRRIAAPTPAPAPAG
jgi:hypothetical protein